MLNDKLKSWAIEWGNNKDYKQDAIPEIYSYYKQYIQDGKFPYLNSVVDYILEYEQISNRASLKTQVYLCSHQYKRETDKEYKIQMLTDGWLELNPEVATKLNGQKVVISGNGQGAIFNFSLSDIFKVFVNDNGYAYLMKPRATRKGYLISNLDNAFYKLYKGG